MQILPYDAERDRDDCIRIWKECGWIGDDDSQVKAFDHLVGAADAIVARPNDSAECLVTTTPGALRHLDRDLPLGLVATVTTSRVLRRRGVAADLTARSIAGLAERGAAVACLGIFDQGYYDRFGFGTGGYERYIAFDPADLRLPSIAPGPMPVRLTSADAERMHAARLAARRPHGHCVLDRPGVTAADATWNPASFGLGFEDESGALGHHFWISRRSSTGEDVVKWMAWREGREFIELLSVLRSLADQVQLVELREPAGIQVQDLLARPLRRLEATQMRQGAARQTILAWWQMRMLDLPACIDGMRLAGEPVRFALELEDPIETRLPDDSTWRGVGGEWTVTFGPASETRRGAAGDLPRMRATLNAFTRLWLGVRPASGLAVTDALEAPPELLEALDRTLVLPEPRPEWDF